MRSSAILRFLRPRGTTKREVLLESSGDRPVGEERMLIRRDECCLRGMEHLEFGSSQRKHMHVQLKYTGHTKQTVLPEGGRVVKPDSAAIAAPIVEDTCVFAAQRWYCYCCASSFIVLVFPYHTQKL